MKKILFTGVGFSICALISCNNDKGNGSGDVLADSSSSKTILLPELNTSATTTPANGNLTVPTTGTNPVSVVPAPVGTTVASGINPAHGQPGHRCDIAVGSPLNSKPTTTPATTITPSVTTPSVTPTVTTTPSTNNVFVNSTTPAKTKTAPGMNPAHGEPGHRCDIAVGSPLNSKPTTPATVVSTPVVIDQQAAKKDSINK